MESDLKRIFDSTAASRYALVNKALKNQEMVVLKRGVYMLAPQYQTSPYSLYYVASRMIPHSYVSFESALSYHGWIPERVTVMSSVIHVGRTKTFITPLGEYSYTFIPTQPYQFLTAVLRREINDQAFFMAEPLRALCDLIYERKIEWTGIDYLTDSLRIEKESLETITYDDFAVLDKVYRSRRVKFFLKKLKGVLYPHAR